MKRSSASLVLALALAVPARAYDHIKFLEPLKGPELARPIAAASSGSRLYVLDGKKGSLLVYDASGALLKTAAASGDKPGAFRDPRGVAVGPSGKVFVADTGNHRVQIFDADGGFVYAFGEKGSEPGHLRAPQSVAIGADGRIYVADTGNDRVQVFTEEGILLYQIGAPGKEPGKLSGPTRVAVDPSDQVYVLDRGNDRIQKFDAAARFVRELPLNGNDFAVDAYGFLYVLAGRDGKVIEESPDGLPIGKFGSLGSGVGQMKKAEGIALSPDGTILVLDAGNARVQRVELSNKLKTVPLPTNIAAKLSVAGPARSWPVTATTLATYGDSLYAYLPQGGPFGIVGPDGTVTARFGASKGKGGDVTRASGGLAVSRKLGVFASDTPGSRLQHFSLEGQWQSNIGEAQGFFDSKSKEGRMSRPAGVAINDEGTVYVADTGNRRVDAFSPDGVFVFSIGPKVGAYELQEPVALAWDKSGFLYFTDKTLKKVFKVEPSGAFLAAWGEEGDGPGQFKAPVSIAFDGRNYLYTLDSELKRVSVHTRDGKWLTDFFAGGRAERELVDPVAVAVQGDRLVVADRGKGKLLSFDLHPLLAAPPSLSTSTKEGVVALSWDAVSDPWQAGYQVFRSSRPGGPFASVGSPTEEKFVDSEVTPLERDWYRVATV
ncbi:MAG: 6-bladed beta-propeller, partial [Elusimicrobia bacterium]|nr:6-bladed beta-propeller [Elusimicrobiota bacterium]